MAYIEEGWHELTGVGFTYIDDEWNGGEIEGTTIELDGNAYVAYVDPEDGYRSSGAFQPYGDRPTTRFPAQKVLVKYDSENGYDDEGWERAYDMMSMYNEDGDLILRVGTDHSDSWYPFAIFEYHPENLPINKGR